MSTEQIQEKEESPVNLAEKSDDEILNMELSDLLIKEEKEEKKEDDDKDSESGKDQAGDQSATGDDDESNESGDTGGADSDDDSTDGDVGGAGEASAKEDDGDGKEKEADPDNSGESDEADQASGDSSEDKGKADDSSTEVDYKAELGKVLAPFKAAKRTITINTIDEARRLMQMGVDYSRKMEAMKPYSRVLKTLEQNNLLDIEKVNFMIDLDKKNPEAIRKFLKDSKIDPMELNLEDDSDYKPTDHMVSDEELAVSSVLDTLRGSEYFDRTVDVITKQWDTASRNLLMDDPSVIRILHDHIGAGIYDKIADRLASERIFGKHVGLSDLVAYKAVGDAMQSEGVFGTPTQKVTPPTGDDHQEQQDLNGSKKDDDSEAEKLRKSRKKAASSTTGNAAAKKKAPNFAKFSDAEIEKFDVNTLQ